MISESAKMEVKRRWREVMPHITSPARRRVNGEISWICPVCENGKGEDGDGLTYNPKSKDGTGLKCFNGKCAFGYGDIIELYAFINLYDFKQSAEELAGMLGIDLQQDSRKPQERAKSDPAKSVPVRKEPERPAEPEPDYSEYYAECQARIQMPEAVEYLKERGIRIEIAQEYGIGFDPAADVSGKGYPAPRIIIPAGTAGYVGRSIKPTERYRVIDRGSPKLFNADALEREKVFVCEGAFDALAVAETGADAVALNSASNTKLLFDALDKLNGDYPVLLLALDNDDPGRKATRELRAGLEERHIPFLLADICGKYKDPNEHLQENHKAFFSAVVTELGRVNRPFNTAYYIQHLMAADIEKYKAEIKTGFPLLDMKTGGLPVGLYIVAAVSSLGKTTFVHQIADQVARSGRDVLYFSLEMSTLELVSKSISRQTFLNDKNTAVESRYIRKGAGLKNQSVQQAIKDYMENAAKQLSIIEGNFSLTVDGIIDKVRQHIKLTHSRPLVCIDYLQVIPASKGDRRGKREVIDETITKLEQFTKETGITVLAISSVGRASYLQPISFESLKESGGLEFTADGVFGLQLKCLDDNPELQGDPNKDVIKKREILKAAKDAPIREIKLTALKFRGGSSAIEVFYNYHPQYDCFVEREAEEPKRQLKRR